MNKNSQTSHNNIIDQLKNTKMSPSKIKELTMMINEIIIYKKKYEEINFFHKQQLLEDKLQHLLTILISYNELQKKNKGILSYFKQNDEIKSQQLQICKEVKELHQQTIVFFQDTSLMTQSAYTQQKQVIDTDFITIKTSIRVNHPKFLPIKSEMNFILKYDPYSDIYELAVLRRFLMLKIKEKTQQKLNENQSQYLQKFDKKKPNKQVMVVSYSKQTKITEMQSEIFPYIITTNPKQNRIYLCKGMKLRFFPQQTLTVLETDTNNESLTHFSAITEKTTKPLNNNVQINNYSYIKFGYLEIAQDLQQQNVRKEQQESQTTSSKSQTFEFYLKNSKQQISDIIPSIDATLFHDEEGFYVLPVKTEFQNYYHLYYDYYLQTKSSIFNICLQIKGKGWIQIETEKQKAEFFNL